MLTGPDAVELIVPSYRSPTAWPGARIVRQELFASEVVRVREVPVTQPMRTAVDLAMHLPVPDAVAVLDGACRLGGVRKSALDRELRRLGRPKTTRIANLIDPKRASVYESLFFVILFCARVALPVAQFEVRRDGAFIARVDFAWPHRRVIVEIDGFAYHSDRAAFQSDRTKQNALVNAGWRVLRFTVADLLLRPGAVIAEVRRALGRPSA